MFCSKWHHGVCVGAGEKLGELSSTAELRGCFGIFRVWGFVGVYLLCWFGGFFLNFLPLMLYLFLGLFFLSCPVTFGPINSLPEGQALSVAQQ